MIQRHLRRSVALLTLMLCGTGHLHAQSCDLQIRDGQAAADIARIHRCLNDRLNRLEAAQVASPGLPAQAAAAAGNPPEFDAKTFSVAVQSARRQGNGVVIILLIKSKVDHDMHLALDGERGQHLLDIGSTHGQTIKAADGIRAAWDSSPDSSFTLVPAGSSLNVILRFGSGFTSTSANLTLNLYEHAGRGRSPRRVAAPMTVSFTT